VRDAIVATAERLNLAVAGGGSHPFHKWHERRIYPAERFRHVSSLYGYLAKQFTVFGQHVHVGVTNGDDAIYLTHRLAAFIPHFIALSASSPYYQGEETSFETSRLHAVSAFPLSGHMPPLQTWAEFNGYFDEMQAYGIVESMKDFYWDIRPKPEYGTIEVRILDTPITVERAAKLAAYVQCLAANLLRERRTEPILPMYRVYSYNRFQACRFGFEATVIDPYTREQRRLGDDLLATLERIAPDAEAMGSREALSALARATRRSDNGSAWLRARYAATRSLNDMVKSQAELWAGERKEE
jgi:carboxylate-amine ligase